MLNYLFPILAWHDQDIWGRSQLTIWEGLWGCFGNVVAMHAACWTLKMHRRINESTPTFLRPEASIPPAENVLPDMSIREGQTTVAPLDFCPLKHALILQKQPETSRNHWYTIGFNHWFLMILMVSRFVFSPCFGSPPGFFVAGVVCGSRRWHQQQRWSTWTWDAGRLWYREHGSAGQVDPWRSLENRMHCSSDRSRTLSSLNYMCIIYIYIITYIQYRYNI